MAPSPARQTFREVVAQVAEKAKARLPEQINGRVESAVKLVLMHDVTRLDDGSIEVGSSTDPLKTYRLEGTRCTCQDFERGQAPEGWCQHRIAAGIQKRVGELLPQAPPVQDYPGNLETPPLPEAPASVNLKVLISGHEVMVTLRDTDEAALLTRLDALLKRPGLRPMPSKPSAARSGNWKQRGR